MDDDDDEMNVKRKLQYINNKRRANEIGITF